VTRVGDLVWAEWDGAIEPFLVVALKGKAMAVVDAHGRAQTLAERRIARCSTVRPARPLVGAEAGAFVAEHGRRVAARQAEVSLDIVWELLADEGGTHSIAELAELALDDTSGVGQDALWRALSDDSLLFKERREGYVPQPASVVANLRTQRAREEEERRQIAAMAEALRTGADGVTEEAASARREAIRLIEELAVHGDEAPRYARARRVLAASEGVAEGELRGEPWLQAFAALVRVGLFDEDEDLNLRRHRIRREFPAWVAEEAERVCDSEAGARVDLTHLFAIAIDASWTTEVDDALAVTCHEGATTVHVLISDPAAFVPQGELLDEEARRRAATLYHPQQRYLMLPSAIAEEAASLSADGPRPVLEFAIRMSHAGAVEGFAIRQATARVARRMSYEAVDALLGDGATSGEILAPADAEAFRVLSEIRRLAELRRAIRAAAGAFVYDRTEVTVRVTPKGDVLFERSDSATPSHRIVSEMMILACAEAGAYCERHRIPAVFRTQAPPDEPFEWSPEAAGCPVAVDAALRKLKKAELSLIPRAHHSLGVGAYTQVTSPLRRYQDLVMHRQLRAHVRGLPPPYEDAELMAIFAEVEEVAAAHNQIERAAQRYWVLKHLAEEGIREVEVLVRRAVGRRFLVELLDYGITAHFSPRQAVDLGERVTVAVTFINPREDRLVLEH
jgi:exoribonuclease II